MIQILSKIAAASTTSTTAAGWIHHHDASDYSDESDATTEHQKNPIKMLNKTKYSCKYTFINNLSKWRQYFLPL